MGFYLEVVGRWDKASKLVDLYGGKIVERPARWEDIPEGQALVAVVENMTFEAAMLCWNQAQFMRPVISRNYFGDRRHVVYVLLSWDKVIENLDGYDPRKGRPAEGWEMRRFYKWRERCEMEC
jgi:hypothetical protein